MSTIERPGINSKWLKRMKTWHRGNMADWWKELYPYETGNLEYYIQHGLLPNGSCRKMGPNGKWVTLKVGDDTHRAWEYFIVGELPLYNFLRLFEFERGGTAEGKADWSLAGNIFASFYIKELVDLKSGWFAIDQTAFIALGFVVGCLEQSSFLARPRIAQRLIRDATDETEDIYDVIGLKKKYPIFHFMLRLMAEYLDEAPHLPDQTPEEPIFQELLRLWREPDPQALVPACLAACDFHTHRCWHEDHEFPMNYWVYIPIEILLLFKLRQLIGLQNPTLDHPIMNTPLGVLPEEVACEPDDLIRRVRDRMIQDGYNEAELRLRYQSRLSRGRQTTGLVID